MKTFITDNMQYNEKNSYLQMLSETKEIIKEEYQGKIDELNYDITDLNLNLSKTKIISEYGIKTLDYKLPKKFQDFSMITNVIILL